MDRDVCMYYVFPISFYIDEFYNQDISSDYFFSSVSATSTFQIKFGMHFLIFFWRSFKGNINTVISFHSLRRIYFVQANRDLPLRYNREHCPTVIKAVFRAAGPFGKGFWDFDLYLLYRLQLPSPSHPNTHLRNKRKAKQNNLAGRLIMLIPFFFSWGVVSARWEFCGEALAC